MECGSGILWGDEELEGWPENTKIRLIIAVVAIRRSGGQILEKSKKYIFSCAWVKKMLVLDWGRHIVRKKWNEGRWLARGTSRGVF